MEMGSGPSRRRTKTIYLNVEGKDVSVAFSPSCSSQDVRDLLLSAAGLGRWSSITLVDSSGTLLAISPSLPANTPYSRYFLKQIPGAEASDKDMFHSVLTKVGDEFTKAFKISEFKEEFSDRLQQVEAHLHEGGKTVEKDWRKGQDLKQLAGPEQNRRSFSPTIPTHRPKRGVPPYPKYIVTTETEEYLKKPTFDMWHWEPNEMISLMEHMYQELGLVAEMHMNPVTLRNWLLEVHENYRDNPFHNFRHCFAVAQMMYGMIHLCHLQDQLSKLDLVTLLTAAICHDLDHPGFSNSYQVNARTELAVRYDDISPLENHHCAIALQILEKPESNIFAYVSAEDFKKIRTDMVDLILATDMSRHAELMEKWKNILDLGMDYRNENHLKMLRIMLLKCCDISNEVRPMEVSELWLDCLLEEYFNQSDREKVEGLPVTPHMDRDTVTRASAQIGFIQFVLLPMFESMNRLFPQLKEPMVDTLKSSLEHYEKLKEQEDAARDEEGVK